MGHTVYTVLIRHGGLFLVGGSIEVDRSLLTKHRRVRGGRFEADGGGEEDLSF